MGGWTARLLQVCTAADAERELRSIGCSPADIPAAAARLFPRCLFLSGLPAVQAAPFKQLLDEAGVATLAPKGRAADGTGTAELLLTGTDRQFQDLCTALAHFPSELSLLAQDLRRCLDGSVASPSVWRTARRDLPLTRPLIMGILNVTPDSFSDGARYLDTAKAVERALELIERGADIIDIGGESTRPGAPPVPEEVERQRVLPVIERLASRTGCPISIDTWKASVADAAMAAGAEIINDISGLTFDPAMAGVAARSDAGLVLMHTRGTPDTMQRDTSYRDLLGEVLQGLEHSVALACRQGIARERLVIDPGIGFGKDAQGNLELLRRLGELKVLGLPILVGTSRKAFIGRILGRETGERIFGTAATVALAVARGAAVLRVHDVAEMRDVALMADAICSTAPLAVTPPEGTTV